VIARRANNSQFDARRMKKTREMTKQRKQAGSGISLEDEGREFLEMRVAYQGPKSRARMLALLFTNPKSLWFWSISHCTLQNFLPLPFSVLDKEANTRKERANQPNHKHEHTHTQKHKRQQKQKQKHKRQQKQTQSKVKQKQANTNASANKATRRRRRRRRKPTARRRNKQRRPKKHKTGEQRRGHGEEDDNNGPQTKNENGNEGGTRGASLAAIIVDLGGK
jgi:hypothetical protein